MWIRRMEGVGEFERIMKERGFVRVRGVGGWEMRGEEGKGGMMEK